MSKLIIRRNNVTIWSYALETVDRIHTENAVYFDNQLSTAIVIMFKNGARATFNATDSVIVFE